MTAITEAIKRIEETHHYISNSTTNDIIKTMGRLNGISQCLDILKEEAEKEKESPCENKNFEEFGRAVFKSITENTACGIQSEDEESYMSMAESCKLAKHTTYNSKLFENEDLEEGDGCWIWGDLIREATSEDSYN